MCGRVVSCVVELCTVWKDSVLHVRVIYCVIGWCTA